MMSRLIVAPPATLLLVLTGTAGALAGGAGSDRTSQAPKAAAVGSLVDAVTVNQAHCPTTYGAPSGTPPPVNPSTAIPIPPVLGTVLSAYANEVVVLAAQPGGRCSAAIGADGSWIITVLGATDRHASVAAQSSGGCSGCAISAAAPYFPSAASLYRQLFGSSSPIPSRPAGETVGSLGSGVVYLEDPPTPKDPYRTRSVVAFQDNPAKQIFPYTLSASCALPSTSVYLCQPILAAFLAEFRIAAHW